MTILITVLKLTSLLLSFFGYILFISRVMAMKIEFIPIFLLSCITLILFFGGLFNILLFTAIAITLIGVGVLVYFAFQKDIWSYIAKDIFSPGILIMSVAMLFFAFLYRETAFAHVDNFTHWSLIVKEMTIYHRFPVDSSAMISFRTYPPGSAIYIYFINLFIGHSLSNMFLAQLSLMIACALPLFAFVRKQNSKIILIAVSVVAITILFASADHINLLVDNLLGVIGLATTAIIFYYRKNYTIAALLSFPLMALTILIKNSGAFFVLINVVFLLYLVVKNKELRTLKSIIITLMVIALSFSFIFIWKYHLNLTFGNVDTKHTMSISNFSNVIKDKNYLDILRIGKRQLFEAFNPRRNVTQSLLFINIASIMCAIVYKKAYKQKAHGIIKAVLVIDIAFVLYQLGIFGMYIFSMPIQESLVLKSFKRYTSSMLMYMIGTMIIGLLYDFNNRPKNNATLQYKKCNLIHAISIVCFAFVMTGLYYNFSFDFLYGGNKKLERIDQKLSSLAEENISGYTEDSYLIYEQNSHATLYGIARYHFYSPKVSLYKGDRNKQSLDEELNKYDHLVVYTSDAFIEDYLGSNATHEITGFYRITQLE